MLKNLKIAKKLGLAFLTTSILTVALGITAIVKMDRIHDAANAVSGNALPSIQILSDLQYQASSVRRLEAQLIITPDKNEVQSLIGRIEKAKEATKKDFKAYEQYILDDADRKMLESSRELLLKYFDSSARMVQQYLLDETNSPEVSSIMFGESRKLYTDGMKIVSDGLKLNNEEAAKQVTIAQQEFDSSQRFIISTLIAVAIISAVLAWRITRSITAPLAEAVNAAKHIADGDLTVNVESKTTDEPGQMLSSLSEMRASLTTLVNSVRDGADGVSTASAQIASGNQDLSSRTESQASALQETASSMEELSATVRQNADNAAEANRIASIAAQTAAEGGQTVYNLVAKMGDINDSSKKIAEIISVIDTIAFQTNNLMEYAKRQRDITVKVLTARGLLDNFKYRHYGRKGWLEVEPAGYMNNGKYGTYPVINVEMWERGYCGDPDSVEGAFQLDELILLNKDEEFEAKLMAQYESQSQKEARQKEEERQRQIKALEQQLATLKG